MTNSKQPQKKPKVKRKASARAGRQQSQPQAPQSPSAVSPGRHAHQCTICSHSKLDEIEQAFVNWASPSELAREYSVSRDAIYRHARALNLIDARRRNVRAALERIIDPIARATANSIPKYAKLRIATSRMTLRKSACRDSMPARLPQSPPADKPMHAAQWCNQVNRRRHSLSGQ
jgi:hypothetical protein